MPKSKLKSTQLAIVDDNNNEYIVHEFEKQGLVVKTKEQLKSAISKLSSSEGTIIVVDNIIIDEDITVPENVMLKFFKGGKLTVNTGSTLTINGGIEAGLFHIFDGDGIISGNLKVEAIYPEWFGAIPNDTNSASQNDTVFSKLINFTGITLFLKDIYYTSQTVQISSFYKIYGISPRESGIICTDSSQDTLSINYGLDFFVLKSFKIGHTVKGTGNGLVLQGNNNNFKSSDVHLINSNYGIYSADTIFVATFDSCRADSCNVGFYLEDINQTSTTVIFKQCYANDCGQGFHTGYIKDVYFIQPIMDVKSDTYGFIKTKGCAAVKISNAHIEGIANVSGDVFHITSNTTDTVIIDSVHCSVDATAAAWNFLNLNYAGNAKIYIDGVEGTQAANVNFIKVSNSSGETTYITSGQTNKLSGISGIDTRYVNGSFVLRDLSTDQPVKARGTTNVRSGEAINTGLNTTPAQIFIQLKSEAGTYPTVYPAYSGKYSTGEFTIRFVNLSDGTANTSGIFTIDWIAFADKEF